MSRERIKKSLRIWIARLDDCYDNDEPLGVGEILGLSNDLASALAELSTSLPVTPEDE